MSGGGWDAGGGKKELGGKSRKYCCRVGSGMFTVKGP